MNIVIISTILLTLLNFSISMNNNNNNYGVRIRNTCLRLIVFNDKKYVKIFKEINKVYNIYYNKSFGFIAKSAAEYNELSEEEKIIIETLFSLCY